MAKPDIISWIGYWDRASGGPRIDRVHSLADLETCRQYNPCMQGGVMWNVTTPQMWGALQAYRGAGL